MIAEASLAGAWRAALPAAGKFAADTAVMVSQRGLQVHRAARRG